MEVRRLSGRLVLVFVSSKYRKTGIATADDDNWETKEEKRERERERERMRERERERERERDRESENAADKIFDSDELESISAKVVSHNIP